MTVVRKEALPLSSFPDRRQLGRRERDNWFYRRAKELEAALCISQALFEELGVDDLVEEVLRTALKVVDAEAGSILLANPDKKELVFRYIKGKAKELIGTSIPWDQGLAGTVFLSGQPELIRDVKQDSRHLSDIDKLTGFVTRDLIVLPLKRWEGDPIGVLEVLNKREGCLDEEDAAVLTVVSAFAAMAIEQARLHEEAKLAVVVRLLGDITHDIKNLLMPVVTGGKLLENELKELFGFLAQPQNGKIMKSLALCEEVLDMIRNTNARLQHRMKEIADCVKGLSVPPQFAPCRLSDVVDNVVKTLRVLADERQISLSVEGLTSLPTIEGDERRLFNCFYNLVNNAIEEVPPGGSITIRSHGAPLGGMVLVSVADTGRGMPPEIRDSLFSARAISRKAGGTGLGTKIIKDVVDAHRGQITVQSQEGVGTTFFLHFPVHQTVLISPQ
jgi:signal transduction histidine kinase